jgi:hypothetical protein
MKATATVQHKGIIYWAKDNAREREKENQAQNPVASKWECQIPKYLTFQDSGEPGGVEIHLTHKALLMFSFLQYSIFRAWRFDVARIGCHTPRTWVAAARQTANLRQSFYHVLIFWYLVTLGPLCKSKVHMHLYFYLHIHVYSNQ